MPSGPFDEVLFPEGVSYGSSFGPGFFTSFIRTQNRHEQRVSLAEVGGHVYDLRESIRTPEKIAEILTFYLARGGGYRGFRLKDWTDFTTGANHTGATTPFDVEIGVGDGTKTVFQLLKRYSNGGQAYVRTITKPRAGSVRVGRDGVEATTGWTVNTASGEVTFSSAPGVGVIVTWGGQFEVPVRFSESVDRLLPVDLSTFGTREISSLPCEEILDAREIVSDLNFGGAYEVAVASDWTFDPRLGRLWVVSALSVSLSGKLWDMSSFPTGTDVLVVANDGANSFDIKTSSGSTLTTVDAGKVTKILVSVTSGGVVTPYAIPG